MADKGTWKRKVNTMKTRIFHVYSERYEAEAFFVNGEMLHYWHCNDANWRPEYMNPLIEKLFGHRYDIKTIWEDSKLHEIFEKYLEETYGYERED